MAPIPPVAVRGLREQVAATVNNDVISSYDLRQRISLLILSSGVTPTQENMTEIQAEALRSLVDEHLQVQEIRSVQARQGSGSSLLPSDTEIAEEIENLAKGSNLTAAQFLAQLKAAGVDASTLRDQFRAEIGWRRYIGARFGGRVNISNDQIAASLRRINADSSKPQYLTAEIFLEAQRVGGQQEALEGAQQLIAQIQQGAPFASVARQFSHLPSASNGGDAGWLISGAMQPYLEQALEQLRPGQVSAPVQAPDGVYILMLREKRAGTGATMVDLKQAAVRLPAEPTPEQLANAHAQLTELRGRIHGCATVEAESAKVQGVVAGDLGEADQNDLSTEFRSVVDGLQIGQVSAPVRTRAGLHLIALCGRRVAAANAPSRDDIEGLLSNQELQMIARRELRNLRNSADLQVR